MMVILHDHDNDTATDIAQKMGRLEWRCSVCEVQVSAGFELDDSGRCQECQP